MRAARYGVACQTETDAAAGACRFDSGEDGVLLLNPRTAPPGCFSGGIDVALGGWRRGRMTRASFTSEQCHAKASSAERAAGTDRDCHFGRLPRRADSATYRLRLFNRRRDERRALDSGERRLSAEIRARPFSEKPGQENKKAGAEKSAGFLVTNNERLPTSSSWRRPSSQPSSSSQPFCSLHGEGVERRSNPPVDWSAAAGREHPTGSARQNFGAKNCDRLVFSISVSGGATVR